MRSDRVLRLSAVVVCLLTGVGLLASDNHLLGSFLVGLSALNAGIWLAQ